MEKLFNILYNRLKNNEDTVLALIIQTEGSAPRNPGAYMLIGKEGRIYGTVGGGNVEYMSVLKGQEIFKSQKSCICEYDLNSDNTGMVCGGNVKILFLYTDSTYTDVIWQIVNRFKNNTAFRLIISLNGIKISQFDGKPVKGIFKEQNETYYAEDMLYDGKVYIFGGGHVTQETVPLLTHIGFRCIVVEDREEYTNLSLFKGAEQTILADFENISSKVHINENDYIVIMTRGHIGDESAEKFALSTNVGYIGVMGSRKKAEVIKRHLLNEGYAQKDIDRVITPIGIDILSETPQEIAVSIAAQLIKIRAERYR